MRAALAQDGFAVFKSDARVRRWAAAAYRVAAGIAQDPAWRGPENLRHQRTWFVGIDALPNETSGAIAGVPLVGPWQTSVPTLALHRAQVSIIYPGYPRQDPSQSDANHRFRRDRAAAHVDGILPIGPNKRRFAREYHAYILSVPLNDCTVAPTVVWRGSHLIMRDALRRAIADRPPAQTDVTEAYQDARRRVFDMCEKVPLCVGPGQAALIHRFALHGTDPWPDGLSDPTGDGRMVAFFRPVFPTGAGAWLADP